ncbi:MAG: hypothetical protein AAB606_03680 [Patescibacteria group bacterium]
MLKIAYDQIIVQYLLLLCNIIQQQDTLDDSGGYIIITSVDLLSNRTNMASRGLEHAKSRIQGILEDLQNEDRQRAAKVPLQGSEHAKSRIQGILEDLQNEDGQRAAKVPSQQAVGAKVAEAMDSAVPERPITVEEAESRLIEFFTMDTESGPLITPLWEDITTRNAFWRKMFNGAAFNRWRR